MQRAKKSQDNHEEEATQLKIYTIRCQDLV